jgi:catechol 2,3-dioxygenase-like lactoylglutathione lyase family enzyme
LTDAHPEENPMDSTISKLMKAYEKMSRRELIQGMALLTAGAVAVEAQEIAPIEPLHEKFTGINHVSIDVSNLEKSTEFYKRAFGFSTIKRKGSTMLTYGNGHGFLVLREGKPPGRVGHVALGIYNFNRASVMADFKSRGVTAINQAGGEEDGLGLHVLDPDGFPIQIQTNDRR